MRVSIFFDWRRMDLLRFMGRLRNRAIKFSCSLVNFEAIIKICNN